MVLAPFARLLVPYLDASLPPLRRLTRQEPALRFTLRAGLEVAIVSRFLVIAGAAEDLEPLGPTQATVAVVSLPDVERVLAEHATAVLRGPRRPHRSSADGPAGGRRDRRVRGVVA